MALPRTRVQNQNLLELCELISALSADAHKDVDVQPNLEVAKKLADGFERIVVLGPGNSGKSTFANLLLKEKVWPVAKFCMTSRICEACHGNQRQCFDTEDQSSFGFKENTGIPKQLVHSSRQSNRVSFEKSLASPLCVELPSPSLEPRVMLVDMPGFDQEREYQAALEHYINDNSDAERVVLIYFLDVKNKVLNSDREFLTFLASSAWKPALSRLLVFVNKCDHHETSGMLDSDEEAVDYGSLIADIHKELYKYCRPQICSLSLQGVKTQDPGAAAMFRIALEALDGALAKQKYDRHQRSIDLLSPAFASDVKLLPHVAFQASLASAHKMPVVGDKVTVSSLRSYRKGSVQWHILPGDVLTVTHVNETGDFVLRGAFSLDSGFIRAEQYQQVFAYWPACPLNFLAGIARHLLRFWSRMFK